MRLFVGLGNPGTKYQGNRHNIGFMAVDEIARRHGFGPWRRRFQGETSEGHLGSGRVILLKPTTYMNESGNAVGEATKFFKMGVGDITVFHDEIELPPAKLRVKIGGGAPPVRTPYGWMMLYHGVSGRIIEQTDHQPFVRYCAGIMILDADDPRRVAYRSPEPLLAPEIEEERTGVVPNVVFPTAVDPRADGTYDVYYGMGDAAIGVARLALHAM